MNKRVVLFSALFLSLYCTLFSQVLDPVKWSFSHKDLGNNLYELQFIATIDRGWHLYSQDIPEGGPVPTSFHIEKNSNITLIDTVIEPKAISENDPNFDMILKFFDKKAVFKQKVRVLKTQPTTVKGYLEFMCCDDRQCLAPQEIEFSFELIKDGETAGIEPGTDTATVIAKADTSLPRVEADTLKAGVEDTAEDGTSNRSLLGFFLIAILSGLAAILTPCVFPMIPMTVTFFMHEGKKKSRARLEAIVYGFSIIAIYTIVGSVLAVIAGPNIANFLSTHWIPNVFFFLIFLVFAASFLGMFEITLPSWLITKSDQKADKGGIVGAVFMALTLVLVSFSCTGPIVGAILVASAGGEVLKPIVGMFGFSLAFALPFTLFAFFPSWLNSLPKSGGWLNSVKVILGFIELALGLKFLSIADQTYHWGILDREVYIAFWIVIFALMGFYLLGKLKFSHDSEVKYLSVPRTLLSIIVFSFVIYLIPGMFGAPLKALSGYLPPQQSHDFDLNAIVRDNTAAINQGGSNNGGAGNELCEKPKFSEFLHLPHGLSGYFDYEQGLACAKKLNKPIFIDFTGHGCVNCREMEANVWSDPRVLKRLREEFVVIALYVDDKTLLPESEWITSKHDGKVKKTVGKKFADYQITRFNINAQPYYVLLDHSGELLTEPRAYDLDVDEFINFLDTGIMNFKKQNQP